MVHLLLHVVLLAGSVLTTGVLAVYAWRRRTEQAALPFVGLMAGFTLYSVAHLAGLLTSDPVWRIVWEDIQWTGTAVLPLFWLLFAMEYTGYDEMLTRRTAGALSAIPVATIVLAWTNPWHGLMWVDNTLVVVGGLALLEQPFGLWGVVYTVTTYGMLGGGVFLFLRLIRLSDRLYASQALLLTVGLAAPVLANLMTVFELTPIQDPPLDMSPYAFSLTGLAFGYALFRHRLFELVPATHQLGRDGAIHDLEDAAVIVDRDRRVVYCNPEATEMLGCDPAEVQSDPVRSLLDDSSLDFETEDALAELERDDAVYEVRTSPIRGRRDRPIGHTIVMQDITARKRRERRLARQRDELERLTELTALVRSVNRALVSATSRDEIEEAVCDRLADTDLYRTACAADILTWDGDADRWTVAGTDGTVPVQPPAPPDDDIGLDERPETPGSMTVADDQHGTWAIVPLAYRRTVYGALGVCSEREQGIPDREREVLAELGELIGHAINAAENRRLLAADAVVELEFRNDGEEDVLLQAASRAGCRLDVTSIVPDVTDGHIAYVRAEGGPVETVADVLGGAPDARVRTIRAEETEGLLEWTVSGDTLLGTLAEHGAHVKQATAENGTARFVVEVASDADVRALVTRVRSEYPDTWLEAKREHDRPIDRADSIPRRAIEDLTDRKQEILEAAYRAGYFDWPRESTAEEIADTLDITPPTLHAHLRKAEDTLLAELFDQDNGYRTDH
ncbi:MAG: histidine kinase N-terminal 7TM domain-containing protein [Halobacteriales archaeon]